MVITGLGWKERTLTAFLEHVVENVLLERDPLGSVKEVLEGERRELVSACSEEMRPTYGLRRDPVRHGKTRRLKSEGSRTSWATVKVNRRKAVAVEYRPRLNVGSQQCCSARKASAYMQTVLRLNHHDRQADRTGTKGEGADGAQKLP